VPLQSKTSNVDPIDDFPPRFSPVFSKANDVYERSFTGQSLGGETRTRVRGIIGKEKNSDAPAAEATAGSTERTLVVRDVRRCAR